MTEIIKLNNIKLDVFARNWREAIINVGDLLVRSGYTKPEYNQEMIDVIETLGPYIVVAPGIALAHSRPSPNVLKTGLSLITLKDPICFGSIDNDPVKIVFGLCARNSNIHIELISQLVQFLDNEDNIKFLRENHSPEEVYWAVNLLKQG